MTSSLQEIYGHLIDFLTRSGIQAPDLEARRIIKHRSGHDWARIIAEPRLKLSKSENKAIENDLERRLQGEPLSRIHGSREFHGLEFMLGPETLDPRPETEILVDWALELFHGKQSPARILDLGTGTGCIIISLLKAWPGAKGVASDISQGALDIARKNAAAHGVVDRLEFVRSDWGQGIGGPFDLIVSNPPYIRESDIKTLESGVRNHDPILALSGGFDGLQAYGKIFSDIKRLLTPVGKGLFEIGLGQEAEIGRLAGKYRIRVEAVRPDYAGITRVVHISNGDN